MFVCAYVIVYVMGSMSVVWQFMLVSQIVSKMVYCNLVLNPLYL